MQLSRAELPIAGQRTEVWPCKAINRAAAISFHRNAGSSDASSRWIFVGLSWVSVLLGLTHLSQHCGTCRGMHDMCLGSKAHMRACCFERAQSSSALAHMQVLEAIANHQVVLIAGETGCGKTTQVPQFILEDALAQHQPVRIVCSQPRRLSAVSVATRVAAERGEEIGQHVGYRIRLEGKGSMRAPLRFVTNGVLVKMLTAASGSVHSAAEHEAAGAASGLRGVTHVIVDEVHERDKFADFALILLRAALKRHPQLRVVLMSATLQSELFAAYFGGCPVLQVPGRTYPVQEYFLEDVLHLTGATYEKVCSRDAKAHSNVL